MLSELYESVPYAQVFRFLDFRRETLVLRLNVMAQWSDLTTSYLSSMLIPDKRTGLLVRRISNVFPLICVGCVMV